VSPKAGPDAEIEPQLKGRLACSPVTTLTATHVLQTHITGTVQGRFVTTKNILGLEWQKSSPRLGMGTSDNPYAKYKEDRRSI
jgi:hypothetical protein